MVLVAKGELLSNKTTFLAWFWESESPGLLQNRLENVISFIEVWWMRTEKYFVDILEQLQWNHEYNLGKVGFSAICTLSTLFWGTPDVTTATFNYILINIVKMVLNMLSNGVITSY